MLVSVRIGRDMEGGINAGPGMQDLQLALPFLAPLQLTERHLNDSRASRQSKKFSIRACD
jgi:hypothetical protein